MATRNIPSSVEDLSYRYKMPCIISNKECRGKGSKTSIMNMGDVAHAIQRDPVYLTKFFGYELGAQTSYTNKKGEGERAVINGHHDTPIFQRLVDDFIEKYVLCMACHLPEIDMMVNKKGLVVATCKACGWHGKLDNCHKLANYISKNPPSSDKTSKKDKKDKKDKKEQNDKKLKKDKGDHQEVKDDTKETETDSGSDEKESDEKGFDNKSRMYEMISAFFPNATLGANGVKHRSESIKEFITNGRLSFAEWIGGFEAYLDANPRATKVWAMTLKTLYDEDLAEEEQILEYYQGQHDGPGFDAAKKAAAPFITWLEISEEGSDEDGGEEDSG